MGKSSSFDLPNWNAKDTQTRPAFTAKCTRTNLCTNLNSSEFAPCSPVFYLLLPGSRRVRAVPNQVDTGDHDVAGASRGEQNHKMANTSLLSTADVYKKHTKT